MIIKIFQGQKSGRIAICLVFGLLVWLAGLNYQSGVVSDVSSTVVRGNESGREVHPVKVPPQTPQKTTPKKVFPKQVVRS